MLSAQYPEKATPRPVGRIPHHEVAGLGSWAALLHSALGARHWVLGVVLVVIAATVSACGFTLRGQAELPFESIYVETQGFSLFGAELRRALRTGSKARVTENPNEAQVLLKIVGERQEKQIISLSAGGKVREFELRYRVAYRLTDRASKDLVPPGEIALRRDLTYDDTQLLAKESEEQLLYDDMKADAVQQMLRRLSVIQLPS